MSAIEQNRKLREQMEDFPVAFSVTRIIHLGVFLGDENNEVVEDIGDFLESLDMRGAAGLHPALDLRNLLEQGDDEDRDGDEFRLAFADTCVRQRALGFLCRVEVPQVVDGELRLGRRKIRWFYGETLEEVLNQANAWAVSLEKSA